MPNLLSRTKSAPVFRISIIVLSIVSAFSYFYIKYNSVILTVDPVVNPKSDMVTARSEHVRDEQGVLGPFVQTLDRTAKDWRNTLGIEVQIVVIHQTGSSINELSNHIFREMNIGNGYETGGLLIVINSASNEARIEVTGSLEGVFTDAMIGLLAHNQLAPYASYNALGMAVMDVLHYLKDHALISALNGNIQLSQKYKNSEGYKTKKEFYSTGGGAKVSIPDVPSDINFKKRVSNDAIHKYLPGESPEESVIAFKNSIRDYIGDPDLELFTESSREMRRRYPFSVYEELARLERIESSEPLVIHQSGDYAVAMSDNPAPGYVPILMRRVDGTWRIDQSETWKSLFFNKKGNYELHNRSTPYYFALKTLGKGKEYDVLPLPVPRDELQQLLNDLQSKNDALSKFRLAELLFRNVFASVEALLYYEQAVKLAPNDPLFLETYADRAMYLGFSDLAIPLYRRLGKANVIDLARAYLSSDKLDMAENALRDMLAINPYHLESLRWLKWVLEKKSDSKSGSIKQKLHQIYSDDTKPGNSVVLEFWPKRPLFNSSGTTYVSKQEIYGYSNFSIIMNNTSNRNVVIDKVRMDSHGTGPSSGLGDIKKYWKYPSGQYRLAPGESVSLHNNNWGFSVDPNHQRLSYAFEICWHAENSNENQCDYQRLNLASDQNVLWTTQGFNEGAELDGIWFASNEAEHFNTVQIAQSGDAINMYMKQSMSLGVSDAIRDGDLFRGVLYDTAVSGKISLRNINEINDACVEPSEEWRDITFRFLGSMNRMMGVLKIPASTVNQQSGCVLDSDYIHYYYLEKLQ